MATAGFASGWIGLKKRSLIGLRRRGAILAGLFGPMGCGSFSDATSAAWDGSVQMNVYYPDGSIGDASSCHPGSVETFDPKSYHAAARPTPACTNPDMSDYLADCIQPVTATPAKCGQFFSTHAGCASCIQTPDTADVYGPIVASGPLLRANVAGCLELSDPPQLACAKALQGRAGCELAACAANCPISSSDPNSPSVYNACALSADSTVCGIYTSAASCVSAEKDAGPASSCFAANFNDFYNTVVPKFCGPAAAPQDAGSAEDASIDAGLFDGAPEDVSLIDGSGEPVDASSENTARGDGAPPDASPE